MQPFEQSLSLFFLGELLAQLLFTWLASDAPGKGLIIYTQQKSRFTALELIAKRSKT
ncbi:MAG: hypothetical protein KIG95_10135 [Comamonas sp.]|nr:hypothetical protein [Comamonas sp.]